METLYAFIALLLVFGPIWLWAVASCKRDMKKLKASRTYRPKLSFVKQKMLEDDYEKLLEEINKKAESESLVG